MSGVINRVASRIQARRRAGSDTNTANVSYSTASRDVTATNQPQIPEAGFILVNEKDENEVDPSVDSDLKEVADELFEDFDYESEEPKPKPEPKKPWQAGGNKDVYEQQLELLQEQLMSAMMDKDKIKGELESSLKESDNLKRRLRELSSRSSSVSSEREVESLRKQVKEMSTKLKGASVKGASGQGSGGRSHTGTGLTTNTSEEGFEEVSLTRRESSPQTETTRPRKGLVQATKDWVYEFLALFTDEQSSQESEEVLPPLKYKKLKDNVQRLMHSSKPWRDTGQQVQGILHWEHVAQTMVMFLLYMYCVWNGWIITVVLLLAIVKLGINYLHASGLAEQFGFPYPYSSHPQPGELGLGDKLQLVRQVAQNCQNLSGKASDSLEKMQNLLLWHQPEATQRLFTMLCLVFVMSLFLSTSYLLTFLGLGLGMKLFITDTIYRKYPKVRDKYDTVHRLWKTLPTDEELYKRQALTEEELSQSVDSASSGRGEGEQSAGAGAGGEFSRRFGIPGSESPLPSWGTGKRCSFMDRDKPLSITRSGKLYMTHSYLCFERMSHALRDSSRVAIPLSDVVAVCKAKPFAVLPGSGMSIEITRSNNKKFMFSAIINRDQVFQSVLDQGMLLGLSWGSDVTTMRSPSTESHDPNSPVEDVQTF